LEKYRRKAVSDQDQQKMHINKRLEAIAWGLFLIMIGGLWLLPDELILLPGHGDSSVLGKEKELGYF